MLGSVKQTLQALLPLVREKPDRLFDLALADYKSARSSLDALAESNPSSTTIHPQYVTRLVSELAADDAIFTATSAAIIARARAI